ncbi:MAG: ATP-binding protein [Desulfobacteraceae bacterium]|nr:ATP-binding protein [Desulfobacteraceae bacterium]
MSLGHQLIKEQLFFRKELKERVFWFIKLRWIAIAGAALCSYALFVLEPGLPVFPMIILILGVAFYNILFLFTWLRLKSFPSERVRPFEIFAHIQIVFDLIAYLFFIFLTGGIHSPFLIFVIFHIILAGILLSPVSCFIISGLVVLIFAGLIALEHTTGLPRPPGFFQNTLLTGDLEFPGALFVFLILAAFILISAFLTTSIKLSLRVKGRELLKVSKALEISNAKLMTLYEMVKEMGSLYDLQKLMDTATRNSAVITGVKGCSIKLLDEKREKFSSSYGLSEDDIAKEAINSKKEGMAAVMCLPLKVKTLLLGDICFYSEAPLFFDAEDKVFFSLIADLTALGIETINRELNKSWFLAKAAHQLRSPMNAIHSMLDMLQKGFQGPVSEKQKETLNRCNTRIKLLGDMIHDLLKIGMRRTETNHSGVLPVDITLLLQKLTDLYSPRALEKNITLTLQTAADIPRIYADEQLLDDLFSNLISNALKYTPEKGEVRIAVSMEDHCRIKFQISDTGIGIPEEDLPNLFSEFFRSENARAFTENGTGLGLVIVKEALDILKGTMAIESTLGQGTCFTCRFPVGSASRQPPLCR